MNVCEAAEYLKLKPVNRACENADCAVTGCYIGDVLSAAMSRINRSDAWITVQKDSNVLAIALLRGAAMVIIADGARLDDEALQRAAQTEIPIFYSDKSAYELALGLGSYA